MSEEVGFASYEALGISDNTSKGKLHLRITFGLKGACLVSGNGVFVIEYQVWAFTTMVKLQCGLKSGQDSRTLWDTE